MSETERTEIYLETYQMKRTCFFFAPEHFLTKIFLLDSFIGFGFLQLKIKARKYEGLILCM